MMKRFIMAAAIVVLLVSGAQSASASAPYESYTYNYYEEPVPAPAPYLPSRAVTGSDLGVGPFVEPNDMFVTEDGRIYILDTGNRRVIALDRGWNVVRVIDSFDNGGQSDGFRNPQGIHVDAARGLIYVADTDNNRIVVLTVLGQLDHIVEHPQSDILPDNFVFFPTRLTVDGANRLFVVSRGMFEGLMQFDENGSFMGYVGTISLQQNVIDRVWRNIATDAQRSQMALYIPTEFVSVDIDHKGFVYSVNIDRLTRTPIRRLNPSGQDVLKRFGYHRVMGDIRYRSMGLLGGPSQLVDIKVLGDGMYAALDQLRGRIFTYNDEGDLLHVFGGNGTQVGTFRIPVAVERQDDRMLVLDRGKNHIAVFEPTSFGKLVKEAVGFHYNGESEEAVVKWQEVLRLNTNYDIAYIGIGKALLMNKQNEEAMEYFQLGMDRKNYSVAFKRHRRDVLKEHFGTALTVLVAAIAAFVVFKLARKWRQRRERVHEA